MFSVTRHGEAPVAPSTKVDDFDPFGLKIISRRQWSGMTVEIHEKAFFLPPTLLPCGADPKVILQLSGAVHLTVNKGGLRRRSINAGNGMLAMLSPDQPDVELEWTGVSTDPLRFLYVHLNHSVLAATAAEDAGLDVTKLDLLNAADVDDPLLKQLSYALAHELALPENQNELYAGAAARMLAMHLIRRHGQVRTIESKARRLPLSAKCLKLINSYVREHIHRPILLEELAAIAGMSLCHFCTSFRRTTGQTPNRYVIAQRIAHAQHLLANTRLTIAHIASLVGYRSVSQFSVLFKRRVGYSPGEYARRSTE